MKSIYCIELEHISIPAAAVVSKPIYTPATVGAIGLPVPVNDPVLPFMCPTAVIVPFVVILPVVHDTPICSVPISTSVCAPIEKPPATLRIVSIYTSL